MKIHFDFLLNSKTKSPKELRLVLGILRVKAGISLLLTKPSLGMMLVR